MKFFKTGLFRVCLVFTVIGACASKPDMVSTHRGEGERYSADEVRQMTVDQPFLLSGDYFRERSRKFGSNRDGNPTGTDGEKASATHEESSNGTSLTLMGQGNGRREGVPSASSLPVKLGFFWDREKVSERTEREMGPLITDLAQDYPLLVVNQDRINEALAISDCIQRRDLLCIADTLSIFPGVQMLTLMERFDVPKSYPGVSTVRFSMVDTGIPFRYPPIEIKATLTDESEQWEFQRGVVQKVLDEAISKNHVMPWFCKAFSKEDGKWVLSAGKWSGLVLGQRLQVSAQGKVVRAPGGLPAGWLPGERLGWLKVELLFGRDLAICSLVEGEGPQPNHLILLE